MFFLRLAGTLTCLMLLAACSLLSSSQDEPQGYDPATIANPAWVPPPVSQLPYGSRIGIMTAVDNELAVVHTGTGGSGNYSRPTKPNFDLPGYITESLRKRMLASLPYAPVLVRPSTRLMREKTSWQDSWSRATQSFGNGWQQEFDAVMKQNRLSMLIVISPYDMDDGIAGTRQRIMGSGLYNRSFLSQKQNAVFSTLRFHRIVGTPGKLQDPVVIPGERLYGDLQNFPATLPSPLSAPLQNSLELAVKNIVDQKTTMLVQAMK